MKMFELNAEVTISIYTKIEAKTVKEAIKIAENRKIEKAEWGNANVKSAWVSDEYDGEPQNIRIICIY
jgi:hypothetical protein